MPAWQSLLFNHIIPSIFDAAVMLLLVLAILFVFRVKNPATRFLFLLLPLIRPFIILLDNPSGMRLGPSDKKVPSLDPTISYSSNVRNSLDKI